MAGGVLSTCTTHEEGLHEPCNHQVTIVAGAGSGIGQAATVRLLEGGAPITAFSLPEESTGALAPAVAAELQPRLMTRTVDTSDEACDFGSATDDLRAQVDRATVGATCACKLPPTSRKRATCRPVSVLVLALP